MSEVRVVSSSERPRLAKLLNLRSAADAMAAYYSLNHPLDRTKIFAYYPSNDSPRGFLVVAMTGLDLFRPLVVPFAAQQAAMVALLQEGLASGRPVLMHFPFHQQSWVETVVELSNVRVADVFRIDPGLFEPIVNVLVVEKRMPGGWPRYEIQARQGVAAAAGFNWKGGNFAEVYLEAAPPARMRGLSKSVLSAACQALLDERRIALLRIEEHERDLQEQALELGFRLTSVRLVSAQALLRETTPNTSGEADD